MAVAVISREGKAIPFLDYSILVFEFAAVADFSSDTIDVSTRGVTTIRGVLEFGTANAQIQTANLATISGSVITGNASTTTLTLVVIGR